MDVELASPRALSLDTAIAILGLGMAGYGGWQAIRHPGSDAGLVGWALIAVGWVLLFPRLFLRLSLANDAVEAGVVTGTRRIPYASVTRARHVEGHLSPRWLGVSASGYHTGPHHLPGEGRVEAFTSRARGPFVLLERDEEDPVVVSPADRRAFLERLGRHGVVPEAPAGGA